MYSFACCYRLLLIVSALVMLSGCSSPSRSYSTVGMTETLEVDILPNGSKMFIYRQRTPEEQIPSHIRVAHSSGRVREGYQRPQAQLNTNRYTYGRLQRNAAQASASLGYCREGFLELDGSVSRYHMWLKGECREAATAEDRARFSGQQAIPVPSAP
jgi:hypothetical protein